MSILTKTHDLEIQVNDSSWHGRYFDSVDGSEAKIHDREPRFQ